ncbi:hypothetical protein Tco_1363552 [Tanacetum coccineum]
MSSGLSATMAEVEAMSESALHRRFRSSYESSPFVSPPDLSLREGATDEGPTAEDEDLAAEDEGPTMGVKGPGIDDEGYGLDDESHGRDDESRGGSEAVVPGGQQQATSVVGTTVSVPLGLGYGALRRRELALEEGDVYRLATLYHMDRTEDGWIDMDIPDYPPQYTCTVPLHSEWTSGSLPISPSHSDVSSPTSSLMIPLTVPSPVATPAAVETEGFLTEKSRGREGSDFLFLRSADTIGGVIACSMLCLREYEQERVAVTFGAIWRPVLALEAWAGQTDAQRAALWHAISDVQGEN